MVAHFKDTPSKVRHAEFQEWRRGNQDGYFLNLRTKTSGMIHRVLCKHPGDCEWQCEEDGTNSLTKRAKFASTSLEALQTWASSSGVAIKRCPDCDPFPNGPET